MSVDDSWDIFSPLPPRAHTPKSSMALVHRTYGCEQSKVDGGRDGGREHCKIYSNLGKGEGAGENKKHLAKNLRLSTAGALSWFANIVKLELREPWALDGLLGASLLLSSAGSPKFSRLSLPTFMPGS